MTLTNRATIVVVSPRCWSADRPAIANRGVRQPIGLVVKPEPALPSTDTTPEGGEPGTPGGWG